MAYDDRKSIKIAVNGDPIPWSVPKRGRWGGSLPNDRLVAWQHEIAVAAMEVFGPRVPWAKAVIFRAHFELMRAMPKSASFGDAAVPEVYWDEVHSMYRMKGKGADLTNLIKAAEDALQSIVYVDDAQVATHSHCTSVWSKTPGVVIVVTRT